MTDVIAILCFTFLSSIFCYVFFAKALDYFRQLKDMMGTQTSRVFDLTRNPQAYWGKAVEVTGYINSEKHLKAPFSKRACIYYHSIEQERIRTVTGSGKNRCTSYSYRDISNVQSTQEFFLQDSTGRVIVNPMGFEVDGQRTFNERTRVAAPLSHGSSWFRSEQRKSVVVGHRKLEYILPPMRTAYIIGKYERKPGKDSKIVGKFYEGSTETAIISLRSEKQLRWIKFAYFFGNFIVGLLLLVLSIGIFLLIFR